MPPYETVPLPVVIQRSEGEEMSHRTPAELAAAMDEVSEIMTHRGGVLVAQCVANVHREPDERQAFWGPLEENPQETTPYVFLTYDVPEPTPQLVAGSCRRPLPAGL